MYCYFVLLFMSSNNQNPSVEVWRGHKPQDVSRLIYENADWAPVVVRRTNTTGLVAFQSRGSRLGRPSEIPTGAEFLLHYFPNSDSHSSGDSSDYSQVPYTLLGTVPTPNARPRNPDSSTVPLVRRCDTLVSSHDRLTRCYNTDLDLSIKPYYCNLQPA